MAALGLGCNREPECIPWQDVEITRSGPDVTEVDVAAVQEEMAQMAEWTGLDEVCLQRVQVVGPEHAERLFEHTDWIGRFNPWDGGKAYVSTGPKLRRTTRHELCHAVDATLGWPSMERESPLLEGAFNDDNRCDAAERFAVICEEGPGRATFRGLVEEACPTVELPEGWAGVPDTAVDDRAFVERTAFQPLARAWSLGVVPTTTESSTRLLDASWREWFANENAAVVDVRALRVDNAGALLAMHIHGSTEGNHQVEAIANARRGGGILPLVGPLQDPWLDLIIDAPFAAYYASNWRGRTVLQEYASATPDVRTLDGDTLRRVDDVPVENAILLPGTTDDGASVVAAMSGEVPGYHGVRVLGTGAQPWDPAPTTTVVNVMPGGSGGPWVVLGSRTGGPDHRPMGEVRLQRSDGTRAIPLPGLRTPLHAAYPKHATANSETALVSLWLPTDLVGDEYIHATAFVDLDVGEAGVLADGCVRASSLTTHAVGEGALVRARLVQRHGSPDGVETTWIEPDL